MLLLGKTQQKHPRGPPTHGTRLAPSAPSRFMDDVTFSYNGANEPESKTNICRPVRQVGAAGRRPLSPYASCWKICYLLSICTREASQL